jgi:chemotaxis protein methyltransferase CheR
LEFNDFKKLVSKKLNINLEGYKEKQLKRRIEHLMNSLGFNSYQDYFDSLSIDKKQREIFLDRLTINVSEFFRNKNIFDKLEKEIKTELLTKKKKLKIWSAACSNGAEPFSVAMILDAITPGIKHRIDATDIDDKMLREVKFGCYKKELVKNISPDRLKKYFNENGEKLCILSNLKSKVEFKKHDLLLDKYPGGYDLIICRNVTIYFTRDTQNELYRKFWLSLNDGGVLFIGATESILNYRELGFTKISPWFYQKST